ncbi:MAG: hypothetical protein JWQ41_1220, partial [Variovorax sp.]|nr:hypothetical protein [Variovorax sp.]
AEMELLLQWFNAGTERDILVRAAVTHLWFETVHPFEDGNGRVGRIWVDLALARDSGDASRLIRMSQRFLERRNEYYDQLKDAQHGALDVTRWVIWFVQQIQAACEKASRVIDEKLAKARFWVTHSDKTLNERQRKVLNLLLDAGPDGFEGGMSTKKYESIARTSRATASRELIQLEALGLLAQLGAGRSTRYRVKLP